MLSRTIHRRLIGQLFECRRSSTTATRTAATQAATASAPPTNVRAQQQPRPKPSRRIKTIKLDKKKPAIVKKAGKDKPKTAAATAALLDVAAPQKKQLDSAVQRLRQEHERQRDAALLVAFVSTCVQCDELSSAHHATHQSVKAVMQPTTTTKHASSSQSALSIDAFNALLRGWARTGDVFAMQEVMGWMRSLPESKRIGPNLHTFAYLLQGLGRRLGEQQCKTTTDVTMVKTVLHKMRARQIHVSELFQKCNFVADEREQVLRAVHSVIADFEPSEWTPDDRYRTALLARFDVAPSEEERRHWPESSEYGGVFLSKQAMLEKLAAQRRIEKEGKLVIVPVSLDTDRSKDPMESEYARRQLERLTEHWRAALTRAFERTRKETFERGRHRHRRGATAFPYLGVLDAPAMVSLMLDSVMELAGGSETFSVSSYSLHKQLGERVRRRSIIAAKCSSGVADQLDSQMQRYFDYFLDNSRHNRVAHNHRQYWQHLARTTIKSGASLEIDAIEWPTNVKAEVGRVLYDIIIDELKVDTNVMREKDSAAAASDVSGSAPALYIIYRYQARGQLHAQIKPHPVLARLVKAANAGRLEMPVEDCPMVTPPVPIVSQRTGGYLLTPTIFVRLPDAAQHLRPAPDMVPAQKLYPVFDALNALAAMPWKVNKDVGESVNSLVLHL